MNKKGLFLLGEETLKIIIAVICIIFLIGFLVSFYLTYTKRSKDLEFAKASLNYLIEGINDNRTEIIIRNPSYWRISSWSSFIDENIPKLCSDEGWKKCICICFPPRGTSIYYSKIPCLDASKNGITCKESDFAVEKKIIEIINPPVILSIDYENKIISKSSES